MREGHDGVPLGDGELWVGVMADGERLLRDGYEVAK
jgi:hypothetical protein